VIFISTYDTITSVDLVCLFVLYIFSKYSVLSHVISDRGLEFVSNFFHFLGTALKIQLYFTLDYYSKDNEQTKHMNQTLKQYICIYYIVLVYKIDKSIQSSIEFSCINLIQDSFTWPTLKSWVCNKKTGDSSTVDTNKVNSNRESWENKHSHCTSTIIAGRVCIKTWPICDRSRLWEKLL